MEVKKIFTKWVAMKLIKQGHNLLNMEDNLKHKGLKVYIFEQTDEMISDLKAISNK